MRHSVLRAAVFSAFFSLLSPLSGCNDRSASANELSVAGPGAAAPTAGATQGATLLNGSFEQGALGWELTGAVPVNAGLGAYHGTKVLEIDPGSTTALKQGLAVVQVPTEVGREYLLSFAYQTGFATGSPDFTVVLNGQEAGDVASILRFFDPGQVRTKPTRSGWLQNRVRFFAEQPTTRIQLGPLSRWNPQIGWGKVWIDQVRLEALPNRQALGRDVQVRVTLPSVVGLGEEVDLSVSLAGEPKHGLGSGGSFDSRPVRHACELVLTSDDPAASLPPKIVFQNQSTQVERVRFGNLGVHRLTLSTSDGFRVLSNPVRVEAQAPMKRSYWGDIHVHTSAGHSGWVGGDGAENYTYARDFADLDFAALSEHFDITSATNWFERLEPATARYNDPGRFVTFIGVESFGYQGHTNHYLRGNESLVMFDPRNPLPGRESQQRNLRSRGSRVLSIPHHFMLLDPADWRNTDRGSLRLAEIYSIHGSSEEAGNWWRHPDHFGFSYSGSRGARGHDYGSALARGHRIGVIACSDSHHLQPGLSGLTCVRATKLNRPTLWDALYRRDCYATTGERILFDFQIGNTSMGGETFLAPGTPILARVEAHGVSPIDVLEIVQGGVVVASVSPGALDYTGTLALGPFSGASTSFYARLRQSDEHRAWTSPIWIDPANTPDLALENRSLDYDFTAGKLQVRARNFGDLPATAGLDVYSSLREPSFGDLEPAALSQPTLLLRFEPIGSGRIRLCAVMYLPRYLQRSFQFSGELQVGGALPHSTTVSADPRGMIRSQGNGLYTWSDTLGVEYQRLDSLSGQITDFEMEFDTLPGTVIRLRPRIDGAPVANVYLGSRQQPTQGEILLSVGRLAMTPPERHIAVSVEPRASQTVIFGNLPPGATYVAVVDGDAVALDSNRGDNTAYLLVPGTEGHYVHWPEYTPGFHALGDDSATGAAQNEQDESHSCCVEPLDEPQSEKPD